MHATCCLNLGSSEHGSCHIQLKADCIKSTMYDHLEEPFRSGKHSPGAEYSSTIWWKLLVCSDIIEPPGGRLLLAAWFTSGRSCGESSSLFGISMPLVAITDHVSCTSPVCLHVTFSYQPLVHLQQASIVCQLLALVKLCAQLLLMMCSASAAWQHAGQDGHH